MIELTRVEKPLKIPSCSPNPIASMIKFLLVIKIFRAFKKLLLLLWMMRSRFSASKYDGGCFGSSLGNAIATVIARNVEKIAVTNMKLLKSLDTIVMSPELLIVINEMKFKIIPLLLQNMLTPDMKHSSFLGNHADSFD